MSTIFMSGFESGGDLLPKRAPTPGLAPKNPERIYRASIVLYYGAQDEKIMMSIKVVAASEALAGVKVCDRLRALLGENFSAEYTHHGPLRWMISTLKLTDEGEAPLVAYA